MSPKRIGLIAQSWYRWKALRLPWRKRFLVGFDLEGNTYWEFRLTSRGANNSNGNNAGEERWRRIVQYPPLTHHSQVRVSPQWHSWLRHTRADPPPLQEQQAEVLRQVRMKKLAEEADRRWEAKPRVMEDPAPREGIEGPQKYHANKTGKEEKEEKEKNPWARAAKRGPGEAFQPEAWRPGTTTTTTGGRS